MLEIVLLLFDKLEKAPRIPSEQHLERTSLFWTFDDVAVGDAFVNEEGLLFVDTLSADKKGDFFF